MPTFQLFSQKMGCDVQLMYDTNGRLRGVELLSDVVEVNELDRVNFFASVPSTIGQMKTIALKNKLNIIEIKPDLTFESFWVKYGKLGSKIKSAKIWERMSEKNKNEAMNYIPKYLQGLGTTSQAYANTYLNAQYWVK